MTSPVHKTLRRLASAALADWSAHKGAPRAENLVEVLDRTFRARRYAQDPLRFTYLLELRLRREFLDSRNARPAGVGQITTRAIELAVRETAEGSALPKSAQHLELALRCLAHQDWSAAEIIELHYVGGLTIEEISQLQELTITEVNRRCRFARAVLWRFLGAESSP